MGDHNQRRISAQQVARQPLHTFHVQVVGGLIQDQQVQVLHQCCGQAGAPALATRKPAHRSVQTQFGHAQPVQHGTDFCVRRPLIGLHAQRLENSISHGGIREGIIGEHVSQHVLGDHGHPQVIVAGYTTGIWSVGAVQDAQQGGLAATVEAHHAYSITTIDAEACGVQEGFQAIGFGNILQVNQVCQSIRLLCVR